MAAGKEQLDRITQDLEAGIRDVFTSGRFASYLKTMSRFHRYSVNNTILIHLQKPDATLLAGYRAWQDRFHRYVRRGEKGIQILAPSPYTRTVQKDVTDENSLPVFDAEGNQVQREEAILVPAFRPAFVFDVSQTEGEPLPELSRHLVGKVKGYSTLFSAMEQSAGIPVVFDDLPFDLDGMYHLSEQKIILREGMSEPDTVCALVHEMTHARLHSLSAMEGMPQKDARTREVEAESVAYAVCAYYGIETGDNSFGYIAAWSQSRELPELKSSLTLIRDTASGLIESIDANLLTLAREQSMEIEPVSVLDRLERNRQLVLSDRKDTPKKEIAR